VGDGDTANTLDGVHPYRSSDGTFYGHERKIERSAARWSLVQGCILTSNVERTVS
jgi:hypothetical protein